MTGRRRSILQWSIVGALTLLGFWLTISWTESAPPKRIAFAGGAHGSSYDDAATRLAHAVTADDGPAVVVRATAGSVENLELLASGQVDVALVQSGVIASAKPELGAALDRVRGVARLYSEPLWVFYRPSGLAVPELTLLSQLQHGPDARPVRVWVGVAGSGTQEIATDLLRINGVTAKNATLLDTERVSAFDAFGRGDIDVLFAVGAATSETVNRLLRMPDVRLMSFVNYRAYAKRIPYLAAVDIEQGQLSFDEHLPPQPVVLLAPAATLLVRDDLHPRVVEKLTKASVALFGGGNVVDLPGEFPSAKGLEVPQHPAARRFLEDGESWASQHLPFWLVRLIATLKLALIPLVAVLIPVARLMPLVFGAGSVRVIRKKYLVLRDIEDRMRAATTADELERVLADNEALRDEVAKLGRDLPARYQNGVYDFRLHAHLVRQEGLERLQALKEHA